LITTAQSDEAGMSKASRSRRVSSGEWDRPLPGHEVVEKIVTTLAA
jgi:hypothetical protein